jgi:hypothetical protein
VRSAVLILLHSPAGLATEKWPVALKVAAGNVKTKATLGPTAYCCHGRAAIGGLAAGAELEPIRQWKTRGNGTRGYRHAPGVGDAYGQRAVGTRLES